MRSRTYLSAGILTLTLAVFVGLFIVAPLFQTEKAGDGGTVAPSTRVADRSLPNSPVTGEPTRSVRPSPTPAIAPTATLHPSLTIAPQFTPSPGQIAFVSNRGGKDNIYLMNSDGTGVRRLTDNGNDNRDPAWSPDGGKLAFSAVTGARMLDSGQENVDSAEIMVMNADGSGQVSLTHNLVAQGIAAYAPVWSRDGKRIAFNAAEAQPSDPSFRGSNVYVVNSNGSGEPRRLTDWRAGLGVGCYNQQWSPDGLEILTYCRALMSDAGAEIIHLDNGSEEIIKDGWYDVVAVSPRGLFAVSDDHVVVIGELARPANAHHLPSAYDYASTAEKGIIVMAWSPVDDNSLAARTRTTLVLFDTDGSTVRELARDLPLDAGVSLGWSPDGSQLVFAANLDGSDEIVIAAPDRPGVIRLTFDPATDTQPIWRP